MTTILTKKKDTTGAPAPGDLTNAAGGAELAVNTFDKRLYTKDSGGTVVEIGTNPSILNVDNIQIDVNTISSTNTNGNINLTPNGTGSVVISKLQVTGTFQLDGNVTVGDSSADTLTVNSTITSNLIFTDNTYDIGASGATRPRSLFLGTNLTVGSLTSGRVPYASTGGLLVDSANMTFNGTTLTANTLTVSTGVLTVPAGTNAAPAITTSGDTNTGIYFPAADTIAFTEGGVEAMRLDSSGRLLVGTTSGATAAIANKIPNLDVESTGYATIGARGYGTLAANGGILALGRSNSATLGTLTATTTGQLFGGIGFEGVNSSSAVTYGAFIAAYQDGANGATYTPAYLTFQTGTSAAAPTERMRIDSAGNLGLGVTPSAWGSAYPGRIQGLGWAIATPLDGGTDTSAFATNAYNSSGSTWNYRANASSALYQQFTGSHRWYIAPSGTAGNAITFTQAMTLDASGQLGIGYTSMNTLLAVNGTSLFGTGAWPTNALGRSGSRVGMFSSTEDGVLAISNMQSGVAAGRAGTVYLGARATTGVDDSTFAAVNGIKENATSGNYQSALTFGTSASNGAISERARITSSGNFAIGTTTTTNFGNIGLYVSGNGGGYSAVSVGASGGGYGVVGYGIGFTGTDGTYKALATDSISWIRFQNGTFEFWNQISATGGTNYTGTRRAVLDNSGAFIATAYIKSDTYLWAAGAGANGVYLANGINNGLISQQSNGTGTTTTYIGNQSITTSSDIRLKENVSPTERNALELLQQWEIIDHTWNDPSDQCENNRNSRGVWTGVVAQQVQPITPWLVNKPLEETNEDGSINPWTMDFGYAVPLLVKAIQELKAIVDAQAVEIAALKGQA